MKVQVLILIIIFAASVAAQEKSVPMPNANPEKETTTLKGYLNSARHSDKKRAVKIPKSSLEQGPVIDGDLNEPEWGNAAVFKDFLQTFPGDNIEPSRRTETYMFFDSKHLYIGFKCWDDKDKIRATLVKRDEIFSDDHVRVYLDTFDDRRRAYLLGWNPLGIQADGILIEGQTADFSVDIVMESKGRVHDWGWSVEVKIPFKSLRYKVGKNKFWGFNTTRTIVRLNNEFDSWMPQDRNIQGQLVQNGRIGGISGLDSERTLQLNPSLTLSETGSRVPSNTTPEGRFVNQPLRQELGLNIKYSITPNLTFDAAINPDFAVVEADAPVVTANQRFPIFFPEKRPFFLEGADVFQTPLFLYNSRTIVAPDVAGKITGKVGKNTIGFLVATDNAPGNYSENDINDPNIRPFIDEFVERNAQFIVFRGKRDFGKENHIGLFASSRTFPEDKNLVGGIDGLVKVNPSTTFVYQGAFTHSKKCSFEPFFDEIANSQQAQRNAEICGGNQFSRYRSGNGFGYIATYSDQKETFGYVLQATGRSDRYSADVGFTRRTDNHWISGFFRKTSKSKPKDKLIRVSLTSFIGAAYSGRGRMAGGEWNANTTFDLQKNTSFSIWGGVAPVLLYEDEFGLARNANREGVFSGRDVRRVNIKWIGGAFSTNPAKQVTFNLNLTQAWDVFDFDFGAGPRFPRVSPSALFGDGRLDPGGGRRITLNASLDLTPIDPLKVTFSYNKARLVRSDTDRLAFDSNIFSLRSTYNFSRFLFVRARTDYNTLRSRIDGQYLLGWAPSPGKGVYLGYNDSLNYNGFNPYSGQRETGFARNSRTFFLRFSYLFRKGL